MPYFILFGFPFGVLFLSGELISDDRVVELQKENNQPVPFGPAYGNVSPYFKMKSVLERSPDIVILGASNALQFRSKFFKESVSFYNGALAVSRIKHCQPFLEKIPHEKTPKLMIVSLSHFFFNPHWDSLYDDDIEQILMKNDYDAFDIFFNSWKKIYRDYFEKKYSLRSILLERGRGRIGLNAIANGYGIRNDGSLLNTKRKDYQFRRAFDRIAKGKGRYAYSKEISPGAVVVLGRFLEKCRERGVYVIGFLPPYAHVVYQKMTSMDEYRYLSEIAPALRPLFDAHGFGFYDFSDLSWVGASDAEAFDGTHGSEKAYLRLFIRMAESDAVLRRYAEDLSYLKMRVKNAEGNHDVFGDSF